MQAQSDDLATPKITNARGYDALKTALEYIESQCLISDIERYCGQKEDHRCYKTDDHKIIFFNNLVLFF